MCNGSSVNNLNSYRGHALTALITLGFNIQAAASLCVLITLLTILIPIRLPVMLRFLFLKPKSLFFFLFVSEGERIADSTDKTAY